MKCKTFNVKTSRNQQASENTKSCLISWSIERAISQQLARHQELDKDNQSPIIKLELLEYQLKKILLRI